MATENSAYEQVHKITRTHEQAITAGIHCEGFESEVHHHEPVDNESNLRPCPNCGADPDSELGTWKIIEEPACIEDGDEAFVFFQVLCGVLDCGMRGPHSQASAKEATELWNALPRDKNL